MGQPNILNEKTSLKPQFRPGGVIKTLSNLSLQEWPFFGYRQSSTRQKIIFPQWKRHMNVSKLRRAQSSSTRRKDDGNGRDCDVKQLADIDTASSSCPAHFEVGSEVRWSSSNNTALSVVSSSLLKDIYHVPSTYRLLVEFELTFYLIGGSYSSQRKRR